MQEVIERLELMLKWSDRIGSDEIYEIKELINILKTIKVYSIKDMEKCFIAGGKASRNITNPGFDEFINTI